MLSYIVHYVYQVMCEDSDIKEMGIPMGPRKKLQGYVKELKQKEVTAICISESHLGTKGVGKMHSV